MDFPQPLIIPSASGAETVKKAKPRMLPICLLHAGHGPLIEMNHVEPIDPYNFGPTMLDFSETALINGMQATELQENLYYAEPSSASILPENTPWQIKPTSCKDTSNIQLGPINDGDGKPSTISHRKEVQASAMEKHSGRRRKRSIFSSHKKEDAKENRRMGKIVRNLERFENQQRRYGKQQLRAIKNSSSQHVPSLYGI
ncbi:hypothetical protein V8C37DRAFT_381660 [Trichoderma ceciliae]